MRKSFLGALLAALLLPILVACGGSSTPAAEPTSAPVAAEPTAAPAAEPTEAPAAEPTEAPAAEPTEEVAAEPTEAPAAGGAPTDDSNCADEAVLCVGLVTDVGRVDDKSFNQSAWEGVKAAEAELGAYVDYIETAAAQDYANNIMLFAEKNYDIIVTVGFALAEATAKTNKKYPNIKFIGVDQFHDGSQENVVGLIFNEDRAGYLAGALAASMSQSGTIAAVLGTDLVPAVVAFKEGYENGAKAINPDITVISTYHPGGFASGFTDPEWGATTAKQAIDQGADVVFGAGGNTGNGALIEVAGNEGKYCIGVDSDQWETVPEAHSCLISSAMKLITPGVTELIKAAKDGNFPSGVYYGDVGLAPFHDFDSVIPAEVKAKLDEINAGLADGSIDTGYVPAN